EPDVRLYRLSGDLARHGGGSAAGLARSIGVSNFNQDMMERIRSTGCRRRPCCRSRFTSKRQRKIISIRITTPAYYLETWRGMAAAQRQGLARSIGVSNFNQDMMERIREHGLPTPAVLQVEAAPHAPPPRVDDPALVAMATKYNKTVPQVVLRY
ncbi:hypothetical protein MSG28_015245, partial [Choristoneura fumiferana]